MQGALGDRDESDEAIGPEAVPLEDFSPAVSEWFGKTFGSPTEPQVKAWPIIRQGKHTLVSAPTGSGKTLAAFLVAIDTLGRRRKTQLYCRDSSNARGATVLYVSPLRSLASDVATNLLRPLSGIAKLDAAFEGITVGVRTADTPASERARQAKKPPDIMATTPESLGLMLLSEGGQKILSTVEYVIVDEVHAVVGSKRGPHLAFSLELLDDLIASSATRSDCEVRDPQGTTDADHNAGPATQRVGLSATQEPLEEMAHFLGGVGREVSVVDAGKFRDIDLEIEVGCEELGAVCSAERWAKIYERIADLVSRHRSTLVFVSTRRLAERVGAHLRQLLGSEAVASHHGSLSRERRQDVEARLRQGKLSCVVSTSSLELGIDVGDVDLVVQVGSPKTVTTTIQRVGRSGHKVSKFPKGKIFPLTISELEEASAIVGLVERRVLDKAIFVEKPLDVLAQQCVAACVISPRRRADLFELARRAWPYRKLDWSEFEAVLGLHSEGRGALLHVDHVTGMVRATRRARLCAITNGGTIPDTGEYDVVHADDGTYLGSLDEDFAIESSIGDVFQLGNACWRVVKVREGQVFVDDAHDSFASFPFWFGEGPARSIEVSERAGRFRQAWLDLYLEGASRERRIEWASKEAHLGYEAACEIDAYLKKTADLLGTLPTHTRVVAERFFDRSGGMQLVVHSPFGSRINRAWGLALRKKFCRSFGFELQAAAGEDAILISLSTMHSFPVEEVFGFMSPESCRHVLEQAVIGTPLFSTRWRWATVCSLWVERNRAGKKVPINLQRIIAQDRLAQVFPQSLACFETLPPGDIPVPHSHPVVAQAIRDCLEGAMDVDGLKAVLEGIREGKIQTLAVDVPEPSAMAQGILQAKLYEFLDDAPLEERRSRGVSGTNKGLGAPYGGSLEKDVVETVRAKRWPNPVGREEVHHVLSWMGFVTEKEARVSGWQRYLEELASSGRAEFEDGRWRPRGAELDDVGIAEGRLQALGFVFDIDERSVGPGKERALLKLEVAGKAMRLRVENKLVWADRAAAAEAFRLMRKKLLESFPPVDEEIYDRFLEHWGYLAEQTRLEGPEGVVEVAISMGGLPVQACSLEGQYLASRVQNYRAEWLDSAISSGRLVWFRTGPFTRVPLPKVPVCLVPFEEFPLWYRAWGGGDEPSNLSGNAAAVYDCLLEKGPRLVADLEREVGIPTSWLEDALEELAATGLVTADSFGLVRWLLRPKRLRARPIRIAGRVWAIAGELGSQTIPDDETIADCVAKGILRRLGVVWRERAETSGCPLAWKEVRAALRRLEERGEIRWGRFVRSGSGEQFAAPSALEYLANVAATLRTNSASETGPTWPLRSCR